MVHAVGDNVTHVAQGDEVVGINFHSIDFEGFCNYTFESFYMNSHCKTFWVVVSGICKNIEAECIQPQFIFQCNLIRLQHVMFIICLVSQHLDNKFAIKYCIRDY